MATKDKITIEYEVEFKRLNKEMRALEKRLGKTEKKGKESAKGIENGFKKAGKGAFNLKGQLDKLLPTLIAVFAADRLLNFGKQLLDTATQMEQFERRASVVFGKSAASVEEFAKRNAKALGFTVNQFKGAAAAIGDILVPLGFAREEAAKMSVESIRLGTAIRRFSGDQRSAVEISQVLAKAFTGEVEGLKTLGVTVIQTDEDFKNIVKTKIRDEGATQSQAKALAIYETVLQRSADALRALETDTDSLIAQQDRAGVSWDSIIEKIAVGFTPVLETLLGVVDLALGGFSDFNDELEEFDENVQKITQEQQDAFEDLLVVTARFGEEQKRLGTSQAAATKDWEKFNEQLTLQRTLERELINEKKDAEVVEIREIRNVFLLTERIKALNDERKNESTAIRRIKQINKEIIPLQEELNKLLDRQTDRQKDANKEFAKRIKLFNQEFNKAVKTATEELKKFIAETGRADDEAARFFQNISDQRLDNALTAAQIDNDLIAQEQAAFQIRLDNLDLFYDENNELTQESHIAQQLLQEEHSKNLIKIEQDTWNARLKIIGNSGQLAVNLISIFGGQRAAKSKEFAVFEIALAEAVAIAELIKDVEKVGITPIEKTALLLEGLVRITAGIVEAKRILSSEPVPGFRTGTEGAPGGVAMVGEGGRERVFLPKGSKVVPNNPTEKYEDHINAMIDGTYDKYVAKNYVIPELKAFAIQGGSGPGGSYDDHRLRKDIRSNKTVQIGNAKEIADHITRKAGKRNWGNKK